MATRPTLGHTTFAPTWTDPRTRPADFTPFPGNARGLHARDGVVVPCSFCGAPTREHGAPRIRIGYLMRAANPTYSAAAAQAIARGHHIIDGHGCAIPTDTRPTTWRWVRRVGPGCPTCADAFDALVRRSPDAREPALLWEKK